MSAAQIALSPIFAAPLHPCSKLLWIFVASRGGQVTNLTRVGLAEALNVNKASISEASRQLESTGWMETVNPGQGHAKGYRCLTPNRGAR